MSDHPQLTAYLLGELSPGESSSLEAQLAASPELQKELDALRQTVSALQSAFAQHVDTPPAVPALDRDKLHSLLRSAVGQTILSVPSSEAPDGAGKIACPKILAAPTRGSNGRGLMVGGAVAMLLGLAAVSVFEPRVRSRDSVAVSKGVQSGPDRLSRVDLPRGPHKETAERNLSLMTPQIVVSAGEEELLREKVEATVASRGTQPLSAGAPLSQVPNTAVLNKRPYIGEAAAVVGLASDSGVTNFDTVAQGIKPADGYSLLSSLASRSHLPAVDAARVIDFASEPSNNLSLNRFDYSAFGRVPTLGDSAAALPDERRFWSATVPFAARESMGQGVVVMDDVADYGYRFLAESARGRQRSAGRGLSQSLDLYALPEIQLEGNDIDGNGLVEPGESIEPLFAKTTDGRNMVPLYDRMADGESAPFGEAAGVPAYTAEVEQLRAAVDNLEQIVASNNNGRGESLGRESKLQDLSEELVKQRVSLEQIEAKLAEPLSEDKAPAEAEPESSQPTSEAIPRATELSLSVTEPEVVSEQTLALAKAREEVNRAYTAWYYREGRIRQAREYIAAAESYAHVPENDFVTPDAQPLSTFGIDVDSASYANVRRFVESNQLPPPDAVRIEELVNSFKYDGPTVADGEAPLALAAEVGICPWQPQHQLLRVALKGKSIDLEKRPAARLVFLVDTSGSMSDANKLPLVKQSLRLLVEQMREQDRLSIVTYNDNAGLWLDSTGGDKREEILAKIDSLVSDGSTNGEAGLKLAYEVAVKQFAEGATNRVMLCTDGDFNVGESSDSAMVKLIEKERQTGVFLNIFGFGSGNLKDSKLEAIADKGNGQYIYIDGIKEARKTLLNELTGTLYTIAKDVKLQIEFNPALVGSYRLVGYENRVMAAQDFANDKVDSGDLGAGHSVVALYEIIPPGVVAAASKPEVEPLKYKRAGSVSARSEQPATPASTLTPSPSPEGRGEPEAGPEETPPGPADPPAAQPLGVIVPVADAAKALADPLASELCTIRLRYKQPTSNESTKIENAVSLPTEPTPLTKDYLWATAVAEFGLVLRHSSFVGSGNFSQVLELAQSAIGDDPTGQRREFLTLVRQTQHLEHQRAAQIAELSKMVREDEELVHRRDEASKNAELMAKASCSGKYKTLLRQLEVPGDAASYGDFKDYGRWDETEYQSFKNLPPGYWVYAAPHWYIWNETTEQAAVTPAK